MSENQILFMKLRSTKAKKPLVQKKPSQKLGVGSLERGFDRSLYRISYKIDKNSIKMTKLKNLLIFTKPCFVSVFFGFNWVVFMKGPFGKDNKKNYKH